jgi:DNA-binding NtrC family response regulator
MTEIVFKSPKTQQVLELAYQVAASDANVLIQGEAGTGKSGGVADSPYRYNFF